MSLRRLLATSGLLAISGLLGCAARSAAPTAPRVDTCRALAADLQALSASARVDQLRGVVDAVASPAAHDVAARLPGRLEALSAEGIRLARESCPRSDAQRACLANRSRALTAVIGSLDRVTSSGVVGLLSALDAARSDLVRCERPERAALVTYAPDHSRLPQGEVDAIIGVLNDAFAARVSGRADGAVPALEGALERARRNGDDPMAAAVLGAMSTAIEDPAMVLPAQRQRAACEAAHAAYRASGDVLGQLGSALCVRRYSTDRGVDPGFTAGYDVLGPDDPLPIHADLFAASHADAPARRRMEERPLAAVTAAGASLSLAVALAEEEGGAAQGDAEDERRSAVVDRLYEDALSRYGPASLEAAELQVVRAAWREVRSLNREALGLAADARQRIEALVGPRGDRVARVMEVEGSARLLLGEQGSCEMIDEALRRGVERWGVDARSNAPRHRLSGWCHSRRGELAASLAAYQESVRVRVVNGEGDDAQAARSRISVGLMQALLHDPAAHATIEGGLARLTALQPADDPGTASAERTAAEGYMALGETELALTHYGHSVAVLARRYSEASDSVCLARQHYAFALLEADRPGAAAEALATAERPPVVDAGIQWCRTLATIRATALRLAGDLPGARRAVTSALRVTPDDFRAKLELASIELHEGRLDAAEAAFGPLRLWLSTHPPPRGRFDGEVRLVEAGLLAARGRRAEAAEVADYALALLRAGRSTPDRRAREAERLLARLRAPGGRR